MKAQNPKEHDRNAKLLILTFVQEFFEFFFPGVAVDSIQFVDKEFVGGNTALTESLKADVLLFLRANLNGASRDIVVILEHKHQDIAFSKKLCRYICHAYLEHQTTIWPILFYTGKGKGKHLPKRISLTCGYDSETRELTEDFFIVDVVRLRDYRAKELMHSDSIFGRLLALLANDVDVAREDLVRHVFELAAKKWNTLSDNAKICVDRFVNSYGGLEGAQTQIMQKEFPMLAATSYTEYYENLGFEKGIVKGKAEGRIEGRVEGRIKGRVEGRIEGEIKGKIEALQTQIEALKDLMSHGEISFESYERVALPVQEQIGRLKQKWHDLDDAS